MMRTALILAMLAAAASQLGCATVAPLRPDLAPLQIAPPLLDKDHFNRDQGGGVTEEGLRAILAAPVELDQTQRLGVLPVYGDYRPDRALPLPPVPAELTRSLDAAGLFQATSEISTDWPAGGDIPGLRELAARYRSGYLLLYRHRFVDRTGVNEWGWLYPTIIGAIFAPSFTLETAGVLEATLFDVRSGTILFTVYERVRASSRDTPWNEELKLEALKRGLLEEAAGKLAGSVVSKLQRLIAAGSVARRPSS
jgi:hypothetical protein